jgi:hypothetical protein
VTGKPETNTWTACSVGDVCVFQVRSDNLHRAFPIERARDFSDRPNLLSTEGAKATFPAIVRCEGTYQSGDRFLLATDALSAYILAEVEAGRKPWNEFPKESEFGAYLKQRRDGERLKNDDVTLVELLV